MGRLFRFFREYKFHFLIFSLSLFIATRFNFDPDLGWHLAIGQKLLQGNFSAGDTFSWTMPGYVWGNYFLYEILVTFLFYKVGYFATAIIFGLVTTLAILFVIPKVKNSWVLLPIFLGICMTPFNLGIRPAVFSFLLFGLFFDFCRKRFFEA